MWTALTLCIVDAAAVAVCAFLAWRAFAAGLPWAGWLVAIPVAYFAGVLAITAFDFALSWLLRTPRPPEYRIGALATLRMFAAEYRALLGAAPRLMSYALTMRKPAPARSAMPVVLVHGVLCNAGVFAPMARQLADAGVESIHAISYGPPLAPIATFGAQLAAFIDDVLQRTGASACIVVAHSMGGLVTRDYLRRYGAGKIARVVTIGTPHHGSYFAWLAPGACMAEMRPDSAWLTSLSAASATPPFVCLWSPHDSMVAPQASAELEGAGNVAFPGVGHNALLQDDAVIARVIEEIGIAARQ